jgi:hypothetical protein
MDDLDRFTAALRRAAERKPYIQIDVSWAAATSIVACLQLALRHPDVPRHTRGVVRGVVDSFINEIEQVVPELAALLRMGDDPAQDV